ncbi:MAG: cysteine dioxygenase family protein [Myxococcaceae bacterium]|nr:cysteine dioxygenase family protein [Myxococcaceae bacterium]MCI0669956.1 cysteine dioxygenase family protein [Myxococcaceae bacterium]
MGTVHTFPRMQRLGLEDVVTRLRKMPGRTLVPAEVAHVLRGVVLEPRSLAPFLWFRPDGYTRNVVHRDERFEVLVLCWAPGAASPIHDHEGQDCWLRVEQGVLALEDFRLCRGGEAPGPAQLETTPLVRRAMPGHVDRRTVRAGIHRVHCLDTPAVTVHVYSRPVHECLVFDMERRECSVRTVHDDTVGGVPLRESGDLQRLAVGHAAERTSHAGWTQ